MILAAARLVGALALTGCASTEVEGEVAGAPVDVVGATFAEVPGVWEDDGAVLVWLLPVEDPCATLAGWLAVSETSREPAALADAWGAAFPERFWQVDVVLRVADPHASQQGEWLTGTAWDAEASAAGQAYAALVHHARARDEAYFAGATEDPDAYEQTWYSHRGLLQIHGHRPGDSLSGVFTTEAVDASDGARDGEVVVRFEAEHCAEVEAILTR